MYVWLHFLRPENWEIIVKNKDRKFEVKLVSILCNIVHKQGRAEAIWNWENVILAPNFFALNHSPIDIVFCKSVRTMFLWKWETLS